MRKHIAKLTPFVLTPFVFLLSSTLRQLLAIAFVLFPVSGHCDWGSSVTELFGSRGKNMEEVATKIATLSEENEILGLDFSPDGKHLAATPFDSATVHIWDWQGNRLEHTLEREKGTNVTVSEPVRYSPDGKLLAICHTPGRTSHIVARVWDADTWNVVHDIVEPGSGGCEAIGFTSEGKSLIRAMAHNAFGFTGDNLAVYDTSTWQTTWGLNTQPFLPSTLAISPDNKLVAIGGEIYNGGKGSPVTIQGQIAIVDMAQRKMVRTVSQQYEVTRLAWNQDGKYIAFGSGAGVGIVDANSGEQLTFEAMNTRHQIRYTSDEKYFIESGFGDAGEKVRIWDGQHQHLLQEIKAIPGCIAVSRDGRFLAMGGDRKIIIWQLK